MRRFWLVFVFLVSCQQTPCQESTAERSALSSLRWVPASASAVVQTVRLQSALELSAQLVDRMPPTSKFVLARQQWQRVLGVDPLKAEDWTGLGVDVAGSATVFEDGGHWIVHARVVAPETLTAWIEARRLANTFIVETQDINGWTVTHLSLQDKTSVLAIAVLGGDTLFLPAARLQPGVEKPLSRLEAVLGLSKLSAEQRFENALWAKGFASEFGDARIAGVIQPAKWLADSMGEGQAEIIFQRLKNQMGPIGFMAHFVPESQAVELDLISHVDPREPTFVRDLKGARGQLPVVGGLVDPGVLGVVRLSAQPRKFFDLLRSLLPPESRTALDQWIQELDSALAIDLVGDVMTNLAGHAVVAIYGFEPSVLRIDNPQLAFDLLTLRATREAVLMPIADRKRMERVLDAWTQASRGKLSRQPAGDTVQYAWLEDGALSWALILGRDHVVFVDSTAAFDHAIAYERSARPLDAALIERGLPDMFEGIDRSGIYLDTTSLSNLLAESRNEQLASYLRPFKSFILTSEMRGQSNHIHIRALLSRID